MTIKETRQLIAWGIRGLSFSENGITDVEFNEETAFIMPFSSENGINYAGFKICQI